MIQNAITTTNSLEAHSIHLHFLLWHFCLMVFLPPSLSLSKLALHSSQSLLKQLEHEQNLFLFFFNGSLVSNVVVFKILSLGRLELLIKYIFLSYFFTVPFTRVAESWDPGIQDHTIIDPPPSTMGHILP